MLRCAKQRRQVEGHTLLAAVVNKDSIPAHRNASEEAIAYRFQQLAGRTEDKDAVVAKVSDDELVRGRACDAMGNLELADASGADPAETRGMTCGPRNGTRAPKLGA